MKMKGKEAAPDRETGAGCGGGRIQAGHGIDRTIWRAEPARDRQRQPLPRRDGGLEPWIRGTQIGERRGADERIFPVERRGLRAPLLLELIRAFARRRPAEVERRESRRRSRAR